MNGEWILIEIARWALPFIVAYIAYRLGVKSEKIQALREYIMGIVKDEYPALYQEMGFYAKLLDDYLESPNVNFDFGRLREFYDRGMDAFMKRHHKDLHLMVDSFYKDVLAEFDELSVGKLMRRLSDISERLLRESLPKEAVDESKGLALSIANTIGPYYIIPDLLNDRDVEVRNKIERCIIDKTSHIYKEKSRKPFVIRGQTEGINYEGISQKTLEKAKSEAKYLVDKFKKLKKEYDSEVKSKLLPLLQKYISNPV